MPRITLNFVLGWKNFDTQHFVLVFTKQEHDLHDLHDLKFTMCDRLSDRVSDGQARSRKASASKNGYSVQSLLLKIC